jgi:hypothetical protein
MPYKMAIEQLSAMIIHDVSAMFFIEPEKG